MHHGSDGSVASAPTLRQSSALSHSTEAATQSATRRTAGSGALKSAGTRSPDRCRGRGHKSPATNGAINGSSPPACSRNEHSGEFFQDDRGLPHTVRGGVCDQFRRSGRIHCRTVGLNVGHRLVPASRDIASSSAEGQSHRRGGPTGGTARRRRGRRSTDTSSRFDQSASTPTRLVDCASVHPTSFRCGCLAFLAIAPKTLLRRLFGRAGPPRR